MRSDAGRRGNQRSEVVEEPTGRGTRTALSAMPSGVPECLHQNRSGMPPNTASEQLASSKSTQIMQNTKLRLGQRLALPFAL